MACEPGRTTGKGPNMLHLSARLSSPGNTALTAESGLTPCQPEPTDCLELQLQKVKTYRQLGCGTGPGFGSLLSWPGKPINTKNLSFFYLMSVKAPFSPSCMTYRAPAGPQVRNSWGVLSPYSRRGSPTVVDLSQALQKASASESS